MPASVVPVLNEKSAVIGVWSSDREFQVTPGRLVELLWFAGRVLSAFENAPQRRVPNTEVEVGNGTRFVGGVFVMIHDHRAPNEELSREDSTVAYNVLDNNGVHGMVRCSRTDPRLTAPPKRCAAPPKPGEGPVEAKYREMAGDLARQHGPLQRVEYLSHFPEFEINFVFERHTVYSGRRRGQHDIHFLSLGYHGEGPRYARAFLDELGFAMTADEINAIGAGAVIERREGRVSVTYPPKPAAAPSAAAPPAPAVEVVPLTTAIIRKDLSLVRAAIARGQNVNSTDSDGATPLHYAAQMSAAAIAKVLVQSGAKVGATDNKGQTPLHHVAQHAAAAGDQAMIGVLLAAGADITARARDGAMPLHVAALAGNHEAARALLDHGASVHAQSNGFTPLHFAAYGGMPEAAQLLIERGADPAARGNNLTPLDMAKKPSHSTPEGKEAVARLIQAALKSGGTRRPAPTPAPSVSDRKESVPGPAPAPQVRPKKKWWQFWR